MAALSIVLLAGEEINVPTGVSVSLGRCGEVNTPLIQACAESWLEPRGGELCQGCSGVCKAADTCTPLPSAAPSALAPDPYALMGGGGGGAGSKRTCRLRGEGNSRRGELPAPSPARPDSRRGSGRPSPGPRGGRCGAPRPLPRGGVGGLAPPHGCHRRLLPVIYIRL